MGIGKIKNQNWPNTNSNLLGCRSDQHLPRREQDGEWANSVVVPARQPLQQHRGPAQGHYRSGTGTAGLQSRGSRQESHQGCRPTEWGPAHWTGQTISLRTVFTGQQVGNVLGNFPLLVQYFPHSVHDSFPFHLHPLIHSKIASTTIVLACYQILLK